MVKRFTDTEKWKELKHISPPYKLLWFFICDDCNHAGIWHIDFEVAKIYTGTKAINQEEALQIFNKNIMQIDSGKKWFIPKFIQFQYNCGIQDLNPHNKVHRSVIAILEKYGIYKSRGLARGIQAPTEISQAPKDKDKDIYKDKDKDKDRTTGEIDIERNKKGFIGTDILKKLKEDNGLRIKTID